MTRRGDLTLQEQEDLEQLLTEVCPTEEERRPADRGAGPGCGARIGHECRNLADGGPLVHFLAHLVRYRRAGVMLRPTTEHELKGNPRRRSEAGRAEAVYANTGRDLPGHTAGRPRGRPYPDERWS